MSDWKNFCVFWCWLEIKKYFVFEIWDWGNDESMMLFLVLIWCLIMFWLNLIFFDLLLDLLGLFFFCLILVIKKVNLVNKFLFVVVVFVIELFVFVFICFFGECCVGGLENFLVGRLMGDLVLYVVDKFFLICFFLEGWVFCLFELLELVILEICCLVCCICVLVFWIDLWVDFGVLFIILDVFVFNVFGLECGGVFVFFLLCFLLLFELLFVFLWLVFLDLVFFDLFKKCGFVLLFLVLLFLCNCKLWVLILMLELFVILKEFLLDRIVVVCCFDKIIWLWGNWMIVLFWVWIL